MKKSTKTELTLPYQEAALLHELNEYTCHADELARLDVEVQEMQNGSPKTTQ